MKTFQDWFFWLLGSTFLSEPYQTASALPGPPALIQGKTLTASPVNVEPSLTRTGALQLAHPLAALAALTHTCRSPGSLLLMHQTTNRLRALSIERTEKRVSGELMVSAILMSFDGPAPGLSRKWRMPSSSGVPMFRKRPSAVQVGFVQPAAWKTLPVTWSIAG